MPSFTRKLAFCLCALPPVLGLGSTTPPPSEAAEQTPASSVSTTPPTGRRDLRIHDPTTPVFAEGAWWIFGTGRKLLAARSDDLQTWTRLDPALREPPAWALTVAPGNQRQHYWAPDLVKIGTRWHLYYSVSEFGKQTSAIGLATSPTLDPTHPDHGWTDEGIVIRSAEGDPYNAIDPSVLTDAEGRLWMSFGSFWRGLYLFELDPKTGLRLDPAGPMHHLAYSPQIEAPTLIHHGDYYYLFINKGFCCRGIDSTYHIEVGRSRIITGPYLDHTGRNLLEGGGRPVLATQANLIGPGHIGIFKVEKETWASMHFYDGTREGAPHLALRRVRWTDDAWPEIAD